MYTYFIDKYKGKTLEKLEADVKKVYPFSQRKFGASGEIYFYTGLSTIDGKGIIINTDLYIKEVNRKEVLWG